MIQKWCATWLLCFGVAYAQAQTTDYTVSVAQRQARWQTDLQSLISGLSATGYTVDEYGRRTRGQKDFVKLYRPASFNAAVESLKRDISSISDEEIVLRLMRLIASANVAHNIVQFPSGMGFSGRLPLSFSWFSDGLVVTAAAPEYSSALGARVMTIGNMTPDKLLAAVAPYIAHENDAWLREQATEYFTVETILRHFGLISTDGRVAVALEKSSAPLTIFVLPTDSQTKQMTFYEALHVPNPLYRSHPGDYYKFYWYQYLEDSQTFYIQYDVCSDNPQLRFAEFTRQVLADVDSHPVKRIVIDLRWNGGGDSTILVPLKAGLRSRLKSIGHVYVLIGPYTFSSALLNAIELNHDLRATLVGEPTGGTPSCYGEVRVLVLPNSMLKVQYTTKLFGRKNDKRSSLQPDIFAPQTIADALAGRDTALAAAVQRP